MSVTLLPVEGGLAVEILDAEGEAHPYRVRTVARNGLVFVAQLTRLDREGAGPYTVAVGRRPAGNGWWTCDCAAAVYSREVCNARGGCKHGLGLRALWEVLEAMEGIMS